MISLRWMNKLFWDTVSESGNNTSSLLVFVHVHTNFDWYVLSINIVFGCCKRRQWQMDVSMKYKWLWIIYGDIQCSALKYGTWKYGLNKLKNWHVAIVIMCAYYYKNLTCKYKEQRSLRSWKSAVTKTRVLRETGEIGEIHQLIKLIKTLVHTKF